MSHLCISQAERGVHVIEAVTVKVNVDVVCDLDVAVSEQL